MLIAFASEFPITKAISRLTTRSTVRVLLILQYVLLINMQTISYSLYDILLRLESDIWTWIFYLSIIVGAVKSLQDVGENIDDHFYDFVSTIDLYRWPHSCCSCLTSLFLCALNVSSTQNKHSRTIWSLQTAFLHIGQLILHLFLTFKWQSSTLHLFFRDPLFFPGSISGWR